MKRLTWDDLLIRDINSEQFRDWLSPWVGVVTGRAAPEFLSKFGFWFLRRPEGHVDMLDVFTGHVERMADTYDDFIREVNERWWHETYLFSELVFRLHQADKIPGPGQCYALAPHPALGGPNPSAGHVIDPKFIMVTDVNVWQSICAQSLGVGQGIGKALSTAAGPRVVREAHGRYNGHQNLVLGEDP